MGGNHAEFLEERLEKLRPTQMTVGFAEVALKRKTFRALSTEGKRRFVSEHPFPAVRGPGGRYYITDGHHLGRALLEEGAGAAKISLLGDLSHFDAPAFWREMDQRGLSFPFDAKGGRQPFENMPRSLREMTDDPYRSLAAQVRRAGGYRKDSIPFAEFKWAEYFRRRLSLEAVNGFPELALQCARKLARHGTALCAQCDAAFSKICGARERTEDDLLSSENG
ncbi:ParB-like protein [Methylocystis bryophila]|nr:ParB/Srx family N-terminal domain-containing protein [Methylocystis bryophila]BDV40020.1 hypothetical protein DSM21852_32730 [Methylocystis bryophila]